MAQPALHVVRTDDDPKATERIWTAVTPALGEAIDDYFHDNRFKTRSAAVRQLIELGLEAAARNGKGLT